MIGCHTHQWLAGQRSSWFLVLGWPAGRSACNFGLQYKVDLASNHEELPTSCCCINGELILPDGVSNRSEQNGYSLAEVGVDKRSKVNTK